MVASVWRGYQRLLEKYPLRTMASTTGTLMATGDCLSQLAMKKTKLQDFDIKRSGRYFVFGFCVFGPMMRGWYLTIDRLYCGKKLAALKMMFTDQLCAAPTFISVFILTMSAMRGEQLDEMKAKWKRDFVPILINNLKLWPAAQLVNFYFLPLQHRVLFVNFIALGWNTYLAWASEKK